MNKISCYEINFQQSCWIYRGWAFYNGLTTTFMIRMQFAKQWNSIRLLIPAVIFQVGCAFVDLCRFHVYNFHIHSPFPQGSRSYVEAQVWYRFCLGAQHIPYRTNTIHVWHISQRITWWVLQEFAYITGHVVCFMNIRHLDHISTGLWFPIFFYVHSYLGKWSNLANIFQMGWNHQLVNLGCPRNQTACPLVGSGILYLDHPKEHFLFGLGLPGSTHVTRDKFHLIRFCLRCGCGV